MFASRFFVSILAVSGLVAYARPIPVVEERAGLTDILGIIGNLQSTVGGILPQIDGLVSSNTATTGNVIPLVSQLVGALSTATSAVGAVGSVSGGSTDVANAIAPIISEITTTLNGATTAVPGLGPILGTLGLDAIINGLLVQLEIIVGGVIALVSTLLVDVANILIKLALTLTLATLGL